MTKQKSIVAYKAFDKDLKCRSYQFAVGNEYEVSGSIIPCNNGFHACQNPLDVLDFYDLTESRFAKVTQFGEYKTDGNKTASAKIKIDIELKLPEFISEAVSYMMALVKNKSDKNVQAASGNYSNLAASGDDSKLAASGYGSKLAVDGNRGVVVSAERDCMVKGSIGTMICLCHYVDGKANKLVTATIGKNKLKADTWYKLNEDAKLVEVK